MGTYINKDSSVEEKIVHKAKFNSGAGIFYWIVSGILLIVCFISFGSMGNGKNLEISVSIAVIAIILFFISLPMAIYVSVLVQKNELVLTTKRLFGTCKSGVLEVKTMDAPLDKIQNVSTTYGILGKSFGYGSIQINTAGGVFVFDYVDNPDFYKTKIMNQIELYKEKADERQKDFSPTDELKKLKELFDMEILTEAEYKEKRDAMVKLI